MTDDCLVAAYRTPPWQQKQRDHGYPGSVLSSASGSAIKRIKAGVKAHSFSTPCQASIRVRGPSPSGKVSFERKKKNIASCTSVARPRSNAHAGKGRQSLICVRGGMRRERTRQEKKSLSLAKDRRNDYGEAPHGARQSIPLRKKWRNCTNHHNRNRGCRPHRHHSMRSKRLK